MPRDNRKENQFFRGWENPAEFLAGEILPRLASWYREAARSLPWRSDPTPYHVWISEIMLQQTRVEAVKPYYERFLLELPDVEALAVCQEDRLMKLWEGLGYYSRARNLQKAARMISGSYDGRLPDTKKELLALPGIGPYTAGAILSIAYGKPAAAVDGNVLRVFARLFSSEADISEPEVKAETERVLTGAMEAVSVLLPPGTVTQSLMELGAIVCVPNGEPHCMICPVREQCTALERGLCGVLPVKKKKAERRVVEKTVLIIFMDGKLLIRKRPEKGLLAGLYELPNYDSYLGKDEVRERLEKAGLKVLEIREAEIAKHIFTHVEWHMKGYVIEAEDAPAETLAEIENEGRQGGDVPGGFLAVTKEELRRDYSIPGAFSAYKHYM